MRFNQLVAVLAVLASTAVWAQDEVTSSPSGSAGPSMDAPWSVGAGLTLTVFAPNLAAPNSVLGLVSGPVASLSIERLLQSNLAILFGLSGQLARSSEETEPLWSRSAALGVGVRAYIGRSGPVAISGHGILSLGFASNDLELNGADERTRGAWGLGLLAGGAVERELVDQLTLRLSASIFQVGYTRRSTEVVNGATTVSTLSSNVSAALIFQPGIELRMAF